MTRNYEELIKLKTFEERFEYLRLDGEVGIRTFGADRYMNQLFYTSQEWRKLRDSIIVRDNGCDLAVDGYDIPKGIIIHHMNPISIDDILRRSANLLDPRFLICVSDKTHNAIHYGDTDLLPTVPITRFQNDTCPWRNNR